MSNLEIYDRCRVVPKEAQKEISAGRLKGMTDINPMWRIKRLTEEFGPCGKGWKYTITNKSLEATTTGEIACFIEIDLYVKFSEGWSEPIPGTGGSMFVAQERNGLHVSDECFKMALTDAISVSCKALGFGADVYWDKDKTKYQPNNPLPNTTEKENPGIDPALEKAIKTMHKGIERFQQLSGKAKDVILYEIYYNTGIKPLNVKTVKECQTVMAYLTSMAADLKGERK